MQIQDILLNLDNVPNLDDEQVVHILDSMSTDKFKMIKKEKGSIGSPQNKYSINMANVLYAIWIKNIETMVVNKFSKKHVRVFRAL